jgi:hypothetical protein
MTELSDSGAERDPNDAPYPDAEGPEAELDADNEAEVNEALEDHEIPALPHTVPTEGGAGPP